MRRTTTLGLMLAFIAVLLPVSVLAPSAQAATTSAAAATSAAAVNLPGGRSNYVVSMMGGQNKRMFSKLSTYQFATNGTVTQKYYFWRQDMVVGYSQAAKWKVSTGYTTAGCRRVCSVRTPLGFQPGSTPKTISGTWSVNSNSHLSVRWSASSYETWRLNNSMPGFSAITIMTGYSTGMIQKGWGVGSNAPLNTGVSAGTIHASVQILGPMSVNYYGVPTTHYDKQSFYYGAYTKCTNGRCLQANQNVDPDKRKWYSSYFANNPATDGRKVYWQSQKGAVSQAENPGTVCIGYGGGHTSAALQAIDDNGKFIGMVGAEASFDRPSYLQAEVGAWVAVLLPMLKTFSTLP